MIRSEKCTPWEDVSLRFGYGLNGFNVDCLRGHKLMQRDGVRLNPVKVAKTTFDGSNDEGAGLLM